MNMPICGRCGTPFTQVASTIEPTLVNVNGMDEWRNHLPLIDRTCACPSTDPEAAPFNG